ncbi:MAG: carbon-nitrogen hydrolase family protein [bacterium]|nr:carbon-nitrogen hydrolase family protein [bacterium]
MKVAAYQAPFLESGSMEAIELLKPQIARCEAEGVEILCCPEGLLGGLADDSKTPKNFALNVESGQLEEVLLPLANNTVSLIIGFTESSRDGNLYNTAAIFHKGKITGLYRKVYTAINHSVYTPGHQLPIFTIGSLTFGIIICLDASYPEPARIIASQGAAALFIPRNGSLLPHKADANRARGLNLLITKATENGITVIGADVAGRQGNRISYGSTHIVNPGGTVIASSKPLVEDLLIADIDTKADSHMRGWDASKNPVIVQTYLQQCYPSTQYHF